MSSVKIVDYGIGNLRSVEQAFIHEGINAVFVHTPEEILAAERLVLPGVGAFGDGMTELNKHGLTDAIRQYAASDRPLLGICLGMQLLFDSSDETPDIPGLGVLPGRVVRFSNDHGLKIPQIGWNKLSVTPGSRLLDGCDRSFVYFVHSYYAKPAMQSDIAATADYGDLFTAAVERGRVGGCQFHPEKSQDAGLHIVRNFLKI